MHLQYVTLHSTPTCFGMMFYNVTQNTLTAFKLVVYSLKTALSRRNMSE